MTQGSAARRIASGSLIRPGCRCVQAMSGTLVPDMALARHTTRRTFAKAAAAPLVVSASTLGLGGATPPSDRIAVAGIGMGSRQPQEHSRVSRPRRRARPRRLRSLRGSQGSAKQLVDAHYGDADCAGTRFHEEVFERDDIDAVVIGTGDRWHAVMSSLAAQAGKDAYCEKPFCLTIAEGRQLVEVTDASTGPSGSAARSAGRTRATNSLSTPFTAAALAGSTPCASRSEPPAAGSAIRSRCRRASRTQRFSITTAGWARRPGRPTRLTACGTGG